MNETVLVTGASSGIGLELATCFAKDKSRLILVARREQELQQLATQLEKLHGVPAIVIPMDLAHGTAAADLEAELRNRSLSVDVLVNNAGFGALGKFADLPMDRQMKMLQLNVIALTELTRRLLPAMVAANRGGVLNVGSVAAFQAGPNMAVYYATKAYVLSFTEALAEELSETRLSISCLCPGATKTEFGEDSGMAKLDMFSKNVMPAADVARAGYEGFRKGETIVVPGVVNNLIACSSKITPRFVSRKLVKRMQRVDG